MNKLLQRQLQKYLGKPESIPDNFKKLFAVISESYDHYEKDRRMIERSIELSSKEMIELNSALRTEKEELKKVHEDLETLFQNIDEVLFSVDMVTYKVTHMSIGCEKLYGYVPADFFADGYLWQKLVHPEDTHIVEQQVSDLNQGKNVINQFRVIHKNKEIRWVENNLRPTTDDTGRLVRIDGISHDISERKEAEEKIKTSEETRRLIMNSALDAIICIKASGNISFWNQQAENIFGWKESEVLGKPLADFIIPKQLRENHRRGLASFLKTGNSRIMNRVLELSAVNRTGEEFPIEMAIMPIKQDDEEFFCAFIRDITERKKAEHDIRVSNERYDLVAKATSDVIWDWDLLTGKVVRAEENMKRTFGYDAQDGINNVSFWSDHVHPDDLPAAMEKLEAAFCCPLENYIEMEYRFRKADGNYAYICDKGFIVRDKDGKATRMIGACQDISKLKEHEIQLKKHSMELAVSNEELEQFAYVASHDLQEPLRMVTSFLTQLDKKYGDVIDDKGKRYIAFAVDGAKRMRQIILDLLEYSRAGRPSENMENIDLNELLEEIQILNRKKIVENRATLIFDTLPCIYGHHTPLRQVFLNLISNALKYSRKGNHTEIHVTANELKDHWEFSVSDNGIGIEEEYFDKVFIIFQRLHPGENIPGTGLGLAITKKIIESQGGKIWLTSRYGKGSTFYFTIKKQQQPVSITAYADQKLPPGNQVVVPVTKETDVVPDPAW